MSMWTKIVDRDSVTVMQTASIDVFFAMELHFQLPLLLRPIPETVPIPRKKTPKAMVLQSVEWLSS